MTDLKLPCPARSAPFSRRRSGAGGPQPAVDAPRRWDYSRGMTVPLDLPSLIQRSRSEAGLSRAALAAAVGVTRAAVSYWELGTRTPGFRELDALAEALQWSVPAHQAAVDYRVDRERRRGGR